VERARVAWHGVNGEAFGLPEIVSELYEERAVTLNDGPTPRLEEGQVDAVVGVRESHAECVKPSSIERLVVSGLLEERREDVDLIDGLRRTRQEL
jgi:hypothetical protein